jgi:UDP-perosamine 4-acetyltransferase
MNERKPIVIIGAGGHAKVVIAVLLDSRETIRGIVERVSQSNEQSVLGVPVIGDDESLLQYPPSDVVLVNAIGSVSSNAHRRDVFNRFLALGYRFHPVRHSSAICARGVSIGEGVQLMAGSVIQPGAVLGDNVILNTMASVDHDCQIGNHVHIAPGAVISGGVAIGEGTHIGTGAVIIQNIRVGKDCLIAAGAVVLRDIPDGTAVAGVPARPMKCAAGRID